MFMKHIRKYYKEKFLAQTMSLLEIKGLCKRYHDLLAVNNLNLTIDEGEVFALLGPNGAGKTTTIKALLGLIDPTAGQILLNNYDVQTEGKTARRFVGYLPENLSLYDNLTGLQTLGFYAELRRADKQQCRDLLEEMGLADAGNQKVGTYSKGMVQRLGLAQAMLGNPMILILDEPTSGLDPRGSWQIRKKITSLNEQGTTIVLSSHILSEVQEVSNRVAILNHGMLMALDNLENLGKKLDLQPLLKIEVTNPSEELVGNLKSIDGVRDAHLSNRTIEVRCNPQSKTTIVKYLEEIGANIVDFKTEEPSLEEVFLRFTEG